MYGFPFDFEPRRGNNGFGGFGGNGFFGYSPMTPWEQEQRERQLYQQRQQELEQQRQYQLRLQQQRQRQRQQQKAAQAAKQRRLAAWQQKWQQHMQQLQEQQEQQEETQQKMQAIEQGTPELLVPSPKKTPPSFCEASSADSMHSPISASNSDSIEAGADFEHVPGPTEVEAAIREEAEAELPAVPDLESMSVDGEAEDEEAEQSEASENEEEVLMAPEIAKEEEEVQEEANSDSESEAETEQVMPVVAEQKAEAETEQEEPVVAEQQAFEEAEEVAPEAEKEKEEEEEEEEDPEHAGNVAKSHQTIKEHKEMAAKVIAKWGPLAFTPITDPARKEEIRKARLYHDEGILAQVMKLDAVESYGDAGVRLARKTAVKNLETRVETLKEFGRTHDTV